MQINIVKFMRKKTVSFFTLRGILHEKIFYHPIDFNQWYDICYRQYNW